MPKKKETRGRKKVLTPKQRQQNIIDSNERWRKANTKMIVIRFNITSDADVLAEIEKQSNKADFIRQLVRNHIEANKK